jgi:hypothetical protein
VDLNREAVYQNALKMGAHEKEAAARADMLEVINLLVSYLPKD